MIRDLRMIKIGDWMSFSKISLGHDLILNKMNRCSGILHGRVFRIRTGSCGMSHAFKFVNSLAYSPFLGPSSFIHWTVHLSDHPFEFMKSFIYGEIPGVKGLDRFFTSVPFLRNIAFFNSETSTLLRESGPGSFSVCCLHAYFS